MADLKELIEGSNLDGLVRYADGLVSARDWAGLVKMRDMCNEATERGKQVWGAAHFAEYRLALDAPAEFAIPVIKPGAGRFSNGPLWEVAASTHTWEELQSLGDPALRALVAHERLIRGDQVTDPAIDRTVVDASLELAAWEPDYPVAIYKSDRAEFPELEVLSAHSWVDLPEAAGKTSAETAPLTGLLDLVEPWLESSNGRGEGAAVVGTELEAIRAIGPRRARVQEVSLGQAVAAMAWTGASGGAYGRRRGTPVGRGLAHWAIAALVGLDDDWPIELDELGETGSELSWFIWDPGEQIGGWSFHIAVSDPADGLAWAVSAVDAV